MSWNSDLGIWSLGFLRGTTPRNADIWTLDIVGRKYELWTGTGKHAYITLFKGPKKVWGWERKPKKCDCYGCNVMRPPTLAEWQAMVEVMNRDDLPTRKLPPRPHSCDNCEGVDPESCLFNPTRSTPNGPPSSGRS